MIFNINYLAFMNKTESRFYTQAQKLYYVKGKMKNICNSFIIFFFLISINHCKIIPTECEFKNVYYLVLIL